MSATPSQDRRIDVLTGDPEREVVGLDAVVDAAAPHHRRRSHRIASARRGGREVRVGRSHSRSVVDRDSEKVDDPIQMYLTDVFTIPVNMAGLPGIAVPGGFSKDGLPVGLQFIAPHFEEERLIQLSSAFQRETDHHLKRPPL